MAGFPPSDVLTEVDRLARSDPSAAADLLERSLTGTAAPAAEWLKLAGLRRALRQPRRALDAVHHALGAAPFDFLALMMRADLLERLGDAEAGLAWDQALAQRPEGELPPVIAAAVARGEETRASWRAQRQDRLEQASASLEEKAGDDERWRIRRFRDNILRTGKIYHSAPTHFHYQGIVEREFHPRDRFPWLAELEAATDVIRAEMLAAMTSERAELLPYVQYQQYEALEQWKPLNNNPDWTAIHLLCQGAPVAENAALCPRTMALLAKLPQPQIPGASPNAMFSLLAPHTAIPPHVGVSNARLVGHLPLVVPEGCWFRVGAETRLWREGEAWLFDDTIEHEALNPSDSLRVVMIFDVWHPDLGPVEQEAVSSLIQAEHAPCPIG